MIRRNVKRNKIKLGAWLHELFASNTVRPEVSFVLWSNGGREAIEAILEQMKQTNAQSEWIVATNEKSVGVVDKFVEAGGSKAEETKVLHLPDILSRHAALCRAAREARGNRIVFLEADGAPGADAIRTFIHALEQGADIALNPYVKPSGKWRVSNETLSAYTFNAFLGRQDLQGATMLNLPFALSRRALAAIGADGLAKPVLALAKATHKGLRITAVSPFPSQTTSGKQEED
ncbi:MAG: glycosyl transferase, partial [Paenibacillaceae bacterium]|nr:glycosyl transferase [Paenibacillaceae bacterium]